MRVELLWWEGCPSYPQALADLRHALREEGIDAESLELRHVETEEEAERLGFPGSPTIRVDGHDVVPPGPGDPVGLNCRVYRLRDGRYSPVPDPAHVRAMLRRVKEEG
jgi:hypothetical protein